MRTTLWYGYLLATPFLGALMARAMLDDFSMYAEDAVLGWTFMILICLPIVSVFLYKAANVVYHGFQTALHRFNGATIIAQTTPKRARKPSRRSPPPRHLTKRHLKQRSSRV